MLRSHYINEIKPNEKVRLAGHVYEMRDLGKLIFIILRDVSGLLQLVVNKKSVSEETFKTTKNLTKENFVVVEGSVVSNDKAPYLGKEVVVSKIDVIAESDAPLPIDVSGKIESTLDKRLDWRFVDMKNPNVLEIFLFQSKLVGFMEEFLRKNRFVRIFTSRITNAATEGGADYFPIMYFDKEAFLAQSPQLYKESVLVSGIDRVYDIGMVYRAEPHHTPRHLCEYVSFDIEMVSESMQDVLEIQQEMLRYAFEKLNKDEQVKEILKKRNIKLEFPKKIPQVSFEEANEILKSVGVATEEHDLTPEGERKLCEYFAKTKKSEFVVVHSFPFKKKPFYLMRHENNPELTYSFDLLYRGLEITSGGQREHRYEERVKNIKDKGLIAEQFDHLRFFKYGMPPHGGLGLGIERLTAQMLNIKNVREASLTPRDPDRLVP
jgi:aspartyl-tRNA synthetase